MPIPASAVEGARSCLVGGNAGRAEQLCRQMLRDDPECADAWQVLGSALLQLRRPDEALAAARSAARLQPGSVEVLYTLAHVLAEAGHRDEAVAQYRRILELRPDHAEALTNLGVALAERGRLNEAEALLRRAVAAGPRMAKAHHNLGVALAQMKRPDEAIECLEQALALEPDYVEAYVNLGNVLNGIGRTADAIARYEQALKLRPDNGLAYNNLGLALTEADRPAEAVSMLQQAVRLRPGDSETYANLGQAYAALGRLAEAEASFHEALRLDPRNGEAHHGLGNACKEQGRLQEALASYQMALWFNPDAAPTQYNRSLALLQSGNYAEGWPAYEWRWKRKKAKQRTFTRPRWDGGPLHGRTILVWSEQGLGDSMQFIRYCAPVKQRGGTVIFQCPDYLMPLLRTCPFPDRVVAEEDPAPQYDVQVPVLSLPGLLGTTLENVPADVPYLHPEPERVARWAERLAVVPGFKVGIEWQGNPYHQWDQHRSVSLERFAALAAVEGVQLVSLQRVHGAEQLRASAGRISVLELGEEVDPPGAAFLDTAAVMRNLDLVITVDTAAAHLAGALAVPVWVAVSAISDWRWMTGRDDSPWYPTMRLFRQKNLGDWDEVFSRMAAELATLAARKIGRGELRVPVAPGELIDRITILEIKEERIADAAKLLRVRAELADLRRARDAGVPPSAALSRLAAELKAVNSNLWDIEDAIRRCEADGNFGPEFVELARSVYHRNDERSALKQRVNELLGSARGDAKEYAGYERGSAAAASSSHD
jgi:tetratricopeptide (TPR) repeat protein